MGLGEKTAYWLSLKCFWLAFFCLVLPLWGESSLKGIPEHIHKELRYEEERLKKEGLDPSSVETKFLEGLVKNIPLEKIVVVVRQEVNLRLRSARMIKEAGRPQNTELIQAMVIALRRGAKEEDLAKALHSEGNDQSIIKQIDRIGELAQSGVYGLEAQSELKRPFIERQDFMQRSVFSREQGQKHALESLEAPKQEGPIVDPRNSDSGGSGQPRQEKDFGKVEFQK